MLPCRRYAGHICFIIYKEGEMNGEKDKSHETLRYGSVGEKRVVRSLTNLYRDKRICDFPTDRDSLHDIEQAIIRSVDYCYRRVENRGRIVSRDALMLRLWNDDCCVEENTLTVNVTRLRKKLEAHGLADVIVTRPGSGYIIP